MLQLSNKQNRLIPAPLFWCLLACIAAGCSGQGHGGTDESGSTTGGTVEAGSTTGRTARDGRIGGGILLPGEADEIFADEPLDSQINPPTTEQVSRRVLVEQLANLHESLDESRRLIQERDARPAAVSTEHQRAERALSGAAEVSRARTPEGESYTIVHFRRVGQAVIEAVPHLMQLDNLRQMTFRPRTGMPPLEEEFAALAQLPDLVALRFEYCKISPRGYEHLAQMSQLEEVELDNCWVSDDNFQFVKGLSRLRKLSFSDFNKEITDTGMKALETHRELEEVHLEGLPLTDAGIAALRNSRGLRIVDIASNQVTEEGVAAVISGVSRQHPMRIEDLSLSSCQVTGHLMSHLGSMPLKRLSLGRTLIRNEDLRYLSQLTSLEELRIHSLPHELALTGEALKHLSLLNSLRLLELDVGRVESDDFRYLRRLDSLETLSLQSFILDDISLLHLAKLTELRNLYGLQRVDLSPSGNRDLQLLVRLRSVVFSSSDPTNRELLVLNGLPNLREVSFFDAGVGIPSDEVRDEMPGVKFTIYD
ncbi:MAG: hypothetical protein WD065_14275 [Planctomycetaceae bacterium]